MPTAPTQAALADHGAGRRDHRCCSARRCLIQIQSPGALPVDPYFFLVGLTFALTVVYSLTLRQAERRWWLVDVQLAADAAIVSAIVYLTGGVNSYFSTLYALPIIAASTLQSWRGGMMVGTLSSVLYTGIVLAQYFGTPVLPVVVVAQDLPPLRVALFTVGLNVFGFFAVAVLTGYLAEGLRRADAQLQRASSELADVQAFSRHVVDSLTSGLATTDMSGRVVDLQPRRRGDHRTARASRGRRGRGDGAAAAGVAGGTVRAGGGTSASRRASSSDSTRSDGRQIEVGLSAAPLMTPRGETGFILTFQDVTESRKLEREARVQQRLAAVGEMAAGIAHEIRNPLASMSGSIQILRGELPLTEEQGQLMDIVIRRVRAAERDHPQLSGLRAAAAAVDAAHGRASDHHRHRDAAAEQCRAERVHRIGSTCRPSR